MEIEIIPLLSIAGIELNSSRSELETERPNFEREIDQIDFYELGGAQLSVHFYSGELIEFLEISKPDSIDTKILLGNLNVFETPAEELIRKIEEQTGEYYNRKDVELPYSFTFLNLELAFWRPTIPEHSTDEDGKYFHTIGLGRKGYYSSERN